MRNNTVRLALIGLLCFSTSAAAWGPQSQIAIVSTAGRMLAKERVAPLSRMEREIRQGASLTSGELELLMPYAETQPVRAILGEMEVLRAVREAGVDPYFAFRLGVLGKVTAIATAPMRTAEPVYRRMYYDDVDQRITRPGLDLKPREMVDSATYFARLDREIEARQAQLERDYRAGLGFEGTARATFGQDISRSINAVGDVWYTVLQRRGIAAGVSQEQKRTYIRRAMAFYIDRGSLGEINAAYKRFETLNVHTADLMKEIGDMMYEAGMRERAVQEYLAVLEKEPDRRDVVRRIAEYYIDLADEELDNDRLETAHDYYARALQVDPLHPFAEAKRLTTARLIRDRDARLAATRAAIAQGRDLEESAELRADTRRYAEAITQLRDALELYREVTSEFVIERRAAQAGINRVTARLRDMRAGLQESAAELTGAGSSIDVADLADTEGALQRETLYKRMIENAYEQELERLRPQVELRIDEQN